MLTIVFDLDGTLIDTAPDLISTLNLILAREGMAAVPYDDARKMIGGGARGMIARALEAEGRDGSKPELDRMFAAFIEHYAAHIADRSRPFPELEPALDRLAADGRRLAVCTNKLEWLSVRLLDHAAAHPALHDDLRSGHIRHAKARPGGVAPDHSACRRRRPTAPSWSAIPGPTFAPPAPRPCR